MSFGYDFTNGGLMSQQVWQAKVYLSNIYQALSFSDNGNHYLIPKGAKGLQQDEQQTINCYIYSTHFT
jgi:hypothetical protein